MRITFLNKDSKTARIPRAVIFQYARTIECVLGKRAQNAELSVIFISKSESRLLNKKYRKKDKPTNVLSFETTLEERESLGDILICPSVARREAAEEGVTLTEWLVRLFVHGALHLFGYDHMNAKEAHRMESIEHVILHKE